MRVGRDVLRAAARAASDAPRRIVRDLRTQLVSASRAHVEWLRCRALEVLKLHGYIALQRGRDGRHDEYTLRFGKRASLVLLPLLYSDSDAPRLTRKWRVWDDYRARHPEVAG